ncbi:hypothetical protein ACIRPK_09630 [Kitasatospora sp. NPDC101801]|uniref:hypothetical protein n=1 Tax=Kitasatospora sp. NPDC101801 TaxID=3364103 RepID=UPI0037FA5E08
MTDDPTPVGPFRAPDPEPEVTVWGARVESPVDNLPVDFEAYVLTNYDFFVGFAVEMLADRHTATEVAVEVFSQIAIDWPRILRSPNLEDHCWSMLTSAVRVRVICRGIETDVRDRLGRARQILDQMRQLLYDPDAEDSDVGLYQALGRLTQREFDTVVLKRLMGRTTLFAASVLAVHPATVDRSYDKAMTHLRTVLQRRKLLKPTQSESPSRGARR